MGLLALIPLPWKIGGIVFLALAAFGGYQGWAYHERTLGAAKVEAEDARAVAAKAKADAALSAKLAVTLQANLTKTQAAANAGNAKIELEPVEPGSQAEIDAAEAVRCMLDKTLCK